MQLDRDILKEALNMTGSAMNCFFGCLIGGVFFSLFVRIRYDGNSIEKGGKKR